MARPRYGTTGKYRGSIEGTANYEEPRLDGLVFTYRGLGQYLEKISLYNKRRLLKNGMANTIKNVFATKLTRTVFGEPQMAIERIFDEKNLNPVQLTREQIRAETTKPIRKRKAFDDQIRESFLPDIIKMAEENSIQLAFVRVKRRCDLVFDQEPVPLREYIANLKVYLTEKDVSLLDFTLDNRLGKKHFASGDHLDKIQGKPLFTRLLAEQLEPIVSVTL